MNFFSATSHIYSGRKSSHRKTCAPNYNLRILPYRCIKFCMIFKHPDLMRQVLHSEFCASVYDCATYRWLDAHLCRSATHIHHVPTHSNNALRCHTTNLFFPTLKVVVFIMLQLFFKGIEFGSGFGVIALVASCLTQQIKQL